MFDSKKPTVQRLGRWQPWHDGHQALFNRWFAKTGQVSIQVREVQGSSGGNNEDENPIAIPHNGPENPVIISAKSILSPPKDKIILPISSIAINKHANVPNNPRVKDEPTKKAVELLSLKNRLNDALDKANLDFEIDLKNYNQSLKNYTIKTKIYNEDKVIFENEFKGKIDENQSKKITLEGIIDSPDLWSAEIQKLYDVQL